MAKKKITEYELLPAQYEFCYGFDPKLLETVDEKGNPYTYTDISLYQGGVGSGKTFVGSLRGLCMALAWGGCRGLVGAKSQDLLDNTTKRVYEEHLQNMGMKEGTHYWFTDRRQSLNLLNGSVIRFKTLSDWQQFMSEEFTFIEFEEASFIEQIVFDKLITRLRQMKRADWKGYYRSLFLHTNPQGKRGWLNKYFINPSTKIKGYRYVIASTRENYHLGNSYVDMLENLYSAEQIEEMIEGRDLDADNTVAFPQFSTDNIKNHIEIDTRHPVILTCDFNYNPMCWYLVQHIDDTWYVCKELIRGSVTTKDMCEAITPLIESLGIRRFHIMGDSHGRDKKTNGSDYTVMTSHFVRLGYEPLVYVQKANPLIKERLAVLRGLIRNAKGVRHLYIDSSCKRLLYNFENAKNNLGNAGLHLPSDKEIQSNPDQLYMIHPLDAISYPMWYYASLKAITN